MSRIGESKPHARTPLTEHKHTPHKHCHKTWLWSASERTTLLELNLYVSVCVRARVCLRAAVSTLTRGSNHSRVLADHRTRLSVSNYIMIIFSLQREPRVVLCKFTQWSSTHGRVAVQGRSVPRQKVCLVPQDSMAKFPFGACVRFSACICYN